MNLPAVHTGSSSYFRGRRWLRCLGTAATTETQASSRRTSSPVLLLLLAVGWLTLGSSAVVRAQERAAAPGATKAKAPEFTHAVVTILTTDDHGVPLRMPQALFFDRQADELYLLNGDNRIVVYGPDYFPQESLGKGRGLDTPVAGCVDGKGNLYIPQAATPTHPPRVTILNSAFLPVREISLAGVRDLANFSPHRIALGKSGKLYLIGLQESRVLVLNADGGFDKWLTVSIDKVGGYLAADKEADKEKAGKRAVLENVAVDALGNLFFLSEDTSRIYVFDGAERYLFTFGSKGGSEGKLSRPRALAIDEAKRCFYVVDYMRHTVLIYDFSGKFRFEFGGRGWGPEWFNYPVDIIVGRQGEVIVADFFNQRAQVFALSLPVFPERTPEMWSLQTKDGK